MSKTKKNELKEVMTKYGISREVAANILGINKDTLSVYKTMQYRNKTSNQTFKMKVIALMEGYLRYLNELIVNVESYLDKNSGDKK
jgi:hypothetical protein